MSVEISSVDFPVVSSHFSTSADGSFWEVFSMTEEDIKRATFESYVVRLSML